MYVLKKYLELSFHHVKIFHACNITYNIVKFFKKQKKLNQT